MHFRNVIETLKVRNSLITIDALLVQLVRLSSEEAAVAVIFIYPNTPNLRS